MRKRSLVALALAVAFHASSAAADDAGTPAFDFSGKITRVVDGDSLQVDTWIAIRLAEIDAPERGQPFGPEATRALEGLAANRSARFEVVDVDRYGRLVARVFVGDVLVNREMVRRGFAWAYTRYVRDLDVIDLEAQARREGLGLWALPEADRDPPWIWRRAHRWAPPRTPRAPFDVACGAKTKCAEMTSCAEAHFHLEACGLAHLDGDRDGIPCESLCR